MGGVKARGPHEPTPEGFYLCCFRSLPSPLADSASPQTTAGATAASGRAGVRAGGCAGAGRAHPGAGADLPAVVAGGWPPGEREGGRSSRRRVASPAQQTFPRAARPGRGRVGPAADGGTAGAERRGRREPGPPPPDVRACLRGPRQTLPPRFTVRDRIAAAGVPYAPPLAARLCAPTAAPQEKGRPHRHYLHNRTVRHPSADRDGDAGGAGVKSGFGIGVGVVTAVARWVGVGGAPSRAHAGRT